MGDHVNDDFWLSYGAKRIDEGLGKLSAAAEKLSGTISVFWGWYTFVFTIGSSIKKIDEPNWILYLLVLPIPLLIVAYCFSIWAQMPMGKLRKQLVDPRSPDDIEKLYGQTVSDNFLG